jgi:2-oxoglutarate ferredoxin oxidoreductase subunit delta
MSVLRIDYDLCDFCGVCVEACPMQIIEIKEKRLKLGDPSCCMECQLCEVECSKQALTLKKGGDSE